MNYCINWSLFSSTAAFLTVFLCAVGFWELDDSSSLWRRGLASRFLLYEPSNFRLHGPIGSRCAASCPHWPGGVGRLLLQTLRLPSPSIIRIMWGVSFFPFQSRGNSFHVDSSAAPTSAPTLEKTIKQLMVKLEVVPLLTWALWS